LHCPFVLQDAGDVLFVPSGWHHMVTNEAPTLSINHNWLNAHNVHWAWPLLRTEHQQATQQLEDCRWVLRRIKLCCYVMSEAGVGAVENC
jgi:ribosomal protein L16 Arg81 hydroxylase